MGPVRVCTPRQDWARALAPHDHCRRIAGLSGRGRRCRAAVRRHRHAAGQPAPVRLDHLGVARVVVARIRRGPLRCCRPQRHTPKRPRSASGAAREPVAGCRAVGADPVPRRQLVASRFRSGRFGHGGDCPLRSQLPRTVASFAVAATDLTRTRGAVDRLLLAAARCRRSLCPPQRPGVRSDRRVARASPRTRPLPLGARSARRRREVRHRDGSRLERGRPGPRCGVRGRRRIASPRPLAVVPLRSEVLARRSHPRHRRSRRQSAAVERRPRDRQEPLDVRAVGPAPGLGQGRARIGRDVELQLPDLLAAGPRGPRRPRRLAGERTRARLGRRATTGPRLGRWRPARATTAPAMRERALAPRRRRSRRQLCRGRRARR